MTKKNDNSLKQLINKEEVGLSNIVEDTTMEDQVEVAEKLEEADPEEEIEKFMRELSNWMVKYREKRDQLHEELHVSFDKNKSSRAN
jgi:selenocysteine lyase/cysteine desulfurase